MSEKSQADYHFPARELSVTPTEFSTPVEQIIRKHSAQSFLDVGCGDGALCRFARSIIPRVAGMEPSTQGYLNAKSSSSDIDFRNFGVYDSVPTEWLHAFDVVASTEVVEHLYDPSALPRLMKMCVRPGGIVIVSTPYHGYLKNLILALTNRLDGHFTALWHHGHIKFWSKRTLTKLMEAEGFEFLTFRGIGRGMFLWKSMMLEFRIPKAS